MIEYCDYDLLEHYDSGTFNRKYKTELNGKIEEIDKIIYENISIVNSFVNKEYKSYRTVDNLILYRIYGKFYRDDKKSNNDGARINGIYASTEFAESLIDAKIRLALDPRWSNTKMFEVKVLVPANTIISVGLAASVELKSGTILKGGAEQIILPFDWPKTWVVGYRRVTSRQLQTKPFFISGQPPESVPKDELYGLVCPKCGRERIEKLGEESQILIIGKKGGRYKMKYRCLSGDCKYYW